MNLAKKVTEEQLFQSKKAALNPVEQVSRPKMGFYSGSACRGTHLC